MPCRWSSIYNCNLLSPEHLFSPAIVLIFCYNIFIIYCLCIMSIINLYIKLIILTNYVKVCEKKLFNNKSNNTTNVTNFFFFWVTIEVYRLWLLYNKMMLTITSYKNNFKLITISAALISCKKKFSKFVSWMWILYLFLAWSLIFLKVMK